MYKSLVKVKLISLTFHKLVGKNVGYTRVYEDEKGTTYMFYNQCKNKSKALRGIVEENVIGETSTIVVNSNGQHFHI